jgi:peptidoglycan/LPS O-acetylase OafA/YrhL
VIFLLLDRQPTSYAEFMKRRAWRIFPVYLVVLAISAFTLDEQIAAIVDSPFHSDRNEVRVAILRSTIADFWPHMATHLALLQGVVPGSVLPYAGFAFVGQAWSISLEWQFYLCAPFLLLCFRTRYGLYSLVAFALACHVLAFRGGYGFLPDYAWLFAIGIASYYLWKHQETFAPLHAIVAAALCLALLCRSTPLLIWFAVLGALLSPGAPISKRICAILATRPLLMLGRISYPIYMSHMLAIYFSMWALNGLEMSQTAYMVAVCGFAIAGTLLASYALHVAIEAPCMKLGARGRVAAPAPQAAQASFQAPA